VGADNLCTYKLWRLEQQFLKPHGTRDAQSQRLIVQGNFTGNKAMKLRVAYINGKLVPFWAVVPEPEPEPEPPAVDYGCGNTESVVTVKVTVLDGFTDEPIEGALVEFNRFGHIQYEGETISNGSFFVPEVFVDEYNVVVTASGSFVTQSVSVQTDTEITIRIIPTLKNLPLEVASFPLHFILRNPPPGNGNMLCLEEHTPTSIWEDAAIATVDKEQRGFTEKWTPVLGSVGVSRPAGSYCTSLNNHVHLNISNAPAANSPTTPTSNETWQYIRSFPVFSSVVGWDSKSWGNYSLNAPNHVPNGGEGLDAKPITATAGDVYPYRGRYYRAKVSGTFNLIWRATSTLPYTDTGINPTTGLPISWNTGLDIDNIEDTDFWEVGPLIE
jgi:hypothetical protein